MRRMPGPRPAMPFARAERGAINLEFMLWLPLLLLWLAGAVTAYDLFRAANLAERAATTVTDILVRQAEADGAALDTLAELQRAIVPRAHAHRLRVASIRTEGGIRFMDWAWSSDPEAPLSAREIDMDALPAVPMGTSLLYVETRMGHRPLIGLGFAARSWKIVQTAPPRYTTAVVWTDLPGAGVSASMGWGAVTGPVLLP